MKITDLISRNSGTAFSFEVLPPLKGTGIDRLKRTIDALMRRGHSWQDIRAGLRRYSAALEADLEEDYV